MRSKRAIAIDKSKKAERKTKGNLPANRSDKDRRKRI
jgi:hypothetical protein